MRRFAGFLVVLAACEGGGGSDEVLPSADAEAPGHDAGAIADATPDAGSVADARPETDGPPAPDAGLADAAPPDANLEPHWERTIVEPPTRSVHRFAWLPWLSRFLLFSGNHGPGPHDDLWTFDGAAWTPLPRAEGDCAPRKNFGLAVDEEGERVYVHAGVWSGYHPDGSYEVRTLDDFCLYDGERWTAGPTEGGPAGRGGQAMAFDPVRRVLLLYGGMAEGDLGLDDLWAFDGETWAPLMPAGDTPGPRLNMHMVWDAARERMVLFGGHRYVDGDLVLLDDTWEWDGEAWTLVDTARRPPARGFYALTYDPVRERVLLLGGAADAPPIRPDAVQDDFWAYDGADWTQLPWPADGDRPQARAAGAIAWDPAGERVVLVAGNARLEELNDTWTWNGTAWSEASRLPGPRSDAAFALGPDGRTAFVFGGYVPLGGFALIDAWRYDGAWHRVPGEGPSRRRGAAAALHGETAVVFGGSMDSAFGERFYADTWTWDATGGWAEVPAGEGPSDRGGAAMAYDPVRGRTVLFGGADGEAAFGDTWEWDGASWTPVEVADAPPARSGAVLRWDPAASALVLLGGVAGREVLNDAWSWDGAAWTPLDHEAAPEPRADVAWAIDEAGRLLAVGGVDATATIHAEAAVYAGGAWTALPDLPAGRFGAGLVRAPDGWTLFGGATSDFQTSWDDFTEALRLVEGPPR